MLKEPRHSHVSLKVLKYFVEHPEARISGAEITKALGIPSGTLYPILFRYEQVSWLESEWEKCKPEEIGRPRRRLYRLGKVGSRRAIEIIEEVSFGMAGGPQWAPG
jgi:DNA-binding PadR family transcriptional regulator